MKKYFYLAVILVSFSGCTPKHYVDQSGNTLRLQLILPRAKQVQFAASVDHYILHDVQQSSSGSWQVSIPADSEFKYFYLVDGLPYVPECKFKEKDDFGSETCLYQPRSSEIYRDK